MDPKEIVHKVQRKQAESSQSNGAPQSDKPADIAAPSQFERIENWAPAHGLRVTLEEYWEKWYERPHPHVDVSYEWSNGILDAKPLPNYAQTEQYRWFFRLLSCYLEVNPIAKLLCLETGAYMSVPDESLPSEKWEVVFKPDIGIILDDNPAPWGADDQRSYIGICDMIVEELSDSTSAEVKRDTEEKRDGYARAGVKEYYILDPTDRHMYFYRLGVAGDYEEIEPDEDGVIRSQVLPDLQFRREDLLREPRLAELARDDVYASYVIPELRDAESRVEKAKERADVETQRADAEAAARRAAEEEAQALKAELARLRQRRF